MRRILVDHARAHKAAKRGGLDQKLSLDEARELPTKQDVDVVAGQMTKVAWYCDSGMR